MRCRSVCVTLGLQESKAIKPEWTDVVQLTANAQQYRLVSHQRGNRTTVTQQHTFTNTRLMALFPGLPRWAGTRKVKPIWILLKQETVSGSGISWTICKSAPRSRQITTPAPHHSVFYRPDALPAAQPTASKGTDYCYTELVFSSLAVFENNASNHYDYP